MHFKIVLALFFGAVFASLISRSIFLAGSPRINKMFFQQFFAKKDLPQPTSLVQSTPLREPTKSFPSSRLDLTTIKQLPNTALRSVAKGIYAQEENDNIVYIRVTEDAEFEEKEVSYNNGKEVIKIKVKFPIGMMK